MRTRILSFLAVIALLIQISGCLQGSASSVIASLVNGGGVHGTGISFGPIAAFGSVIVNGSRYDTNNAVFLINKQSASQGDLVVGQIIRLESDENDNALLVEYVETVKGPVQSIDLASNTFIVLGQTVHTTATTTFENATLSDLTIGDIAEVSGLRDENKIIQASYVEKVNSSLTYQVTGIISDLSVSTFKIADLIVTHNDPSISDGMLVDVIGFAGDFDGTTFVASETRSGFGLNPKEGAEIEAEGIITNFSSASLFEINHITIHTDANTVVENGLLADIEQGLTVEVEGVSIGAGEILATKIKIEPESHLKVSSVVEAVDVANSSITLTGYLITVNNSTSFKDKSELKLQLFGINDINVGDYLEISAFDLGDGIIATKVERKNVKNEIKLVGPVQSIDNVLFNITVLDTAVTTDMFTEFKDENKNVLTQGQFFMSVSVGALVEAKWDAGAGVTSVAKEIEFANEE